MRKKDYIKFAAMLKEQHDQTKVLARPDAWIHVEEIIIATADIFAEDNPNFDRDRFYKACGKK